MAGHAITVQRTGVGVEAGETQPVDRAVPADQRSSMPIADDRIVLDALRHRHMAAADLGTQDAAADLGLTVLAPG